jgi:hypothetical protein
MPAKPKMTLGLTVKSSTKPAKSCLLATLKGTSEKLVLTKSVGLVVAALLGTSREDFLTLISGLNLHVEFRSTKRETERILYLCFYITRTSRRIPRVLCEIHFHVFHFNRRNKGRNSTRTWQSIVTNSKSLETQM